MPDWAPGSVVHPVVVNLSFKPDGSISAVGTSYEVTLPSGASAGYQSANWTPPAVHGKAMQKAMDQLFTDLAAQTGATVKHGMDDPPPPPVLVTPPAPLPTAPVAGTAKP